MDLQRLRSEYTEYISKGIRFALKETGKRHFPDSTRIIVNAYSPLSEWDQLLGFNIIVTDRPSRYEFGLSVASEDDYELLKSFYEYLELYPMKIESND